MDPVTFNTAINTLALFTFNYIIPFLGVSCLWALFGLLALIIFFNLDIKPFANEVIWGVFIIILVGPLSVVFGVAAYYLVGANRGSVKKHNP